MSENVRPIPIRKLLIATTAASAALMCAGCSLYTAPGDDSPGDPPAAADARRRTPIDAAPVRDAGVPVDSSIDAPLPDALPEVPPDAYPWVACHDDEDEFEPNDDVMAAPNPPHTIYSDGWVAGSWRIHACIEGSNEDWYLITASELPLMNDPNYETPRVILRLTAKNADICQDPVWCGSVILPAGPEHTVTVELIGAQSGELLAEQSDDQGVILLDAYGEALNEDFFVRVYGPAEAWYNYSLRIAIDSTGSEDECEC
ncbi:hypothetical protein [Haliangium sp.]|uniref:hypothetical protein n=1 Tax=Haliangium sp. TaxID=2663208 RepID=UPI003D148917